MSASKIQATNQLFPTAQKPPLCILAVRPSRIGINNRLAGTNIYLSQNGGFPGNGQCSIFKPNSRVHYDPFCDDFGPMSALSIIEFVEQLENHVHEHETQGLRNVIYCAEAGPRALTNAAFLLGSYLLLKLNKSASEIIEIFQDIDASLLEFYRDATYQKPSFVLNLSDCWGALERGMKKGWFAYPNSDDFYKWGMIDKDSYGHYDNPLNADLHEIIPKKLIIFRGPKDLQGQEFKNILKNGQFIFRDFSPEYYLDIFQQLSVDRVVRLNQARYNHKVFSSEGIQHIDLPCNEGTSTPPPAVVYDFFQIMDKSEGCAALHGNSSFGMAGTLAALYLMRTHQFTAREAIAWVRIMRPGCIIGAQQQYLCTIEAATRQVVESLKVRQQQQQSSSTTATSFVYGDCVGGDGEGDYATKKFSEPPKRLSAHSSFLMARTRIHDEATEAGVSTNVSLENSPRATLSRASSGGCGGMDEWRRRRTFPGSFKG